MELEEKKIPNTTNRKYFSQVGYEYIRVVEKLILHLFLFH
ncbi:hypothetical protein LEP1GSC060_0464 [Leptospira weilii serovar Ranarum str. ICFT]|uniref:Uncharacterized protein n=1 Tax=Leptospira weilii serovar Ranarum str. ICFT TaxID=1218598 RepID=N1WHH1_9LEPT|nr:hypothetical protein LEP1GSC060_0464 [Leptospira weilii serovar Ranarum str. ICFT]